VQVASQLRRADLGEDAEGETDEVVVVAVEVDADPVGRHHEQLRLLVEELGESWVVAAVPR
jgi:hypothetical protein